MDLASCDKDDVVWPQVICLALDDVVDMAAEEQDDLMEIVVVEGDIAQLPVVQVEDTEVAAQIALFGIRLHQNTSCFYHRTLFAIYKAYFVIFLHIDDCYNRAIASKKERVTGMMIVRIYQVEKQEYMVMDGTTGFMPEAAAIRLLAHRRFGVGADRVLVFTGSEEIPSFKAFTADGEEQEMQESDYAALAKVKEDFEVHLTDSFVQRMRQADRAKMAAAC